MRTKSVLLTLVLLLPATLPAQARRKVIINEDASGPGGSNMQTLMIMIQSPQVEVLGITVVSGDAWRDEEVAHTLRLLEIMGRTDIPVMPGAAFPLVRSRQEAQLWPALVKQIEASGTPLARYIARFAMLTPGADIMWDELAAAAWIDPSLITKSETRYMAVDLDRGAGYGNTLTWGTKDALRPASQPVEIQFDLDAEKFYRMFVRLMTAQTPTH